MTPAIAVRRVGPNALLVQRPHSPVVHVSGPPTARRGRREPVCHQRGLRWWPTASTVRRLCARCSAWVVRHTQPVALAEQDLADMVTAARTIPGLDEAVLAIVTTRTYMQLHYQVRVARERILAATNQQQRRPA